MSGKFNKYIREPYWYLFGIKVRIKMTFDFFLTICVMALVVVILFMPKNEQIEVAHYKPNEISTSIEEKEIVSAPEVKEESEISYDDIITDLATATDEELMALLETCQQMLKKEISKGLKNSHLSTVSSLDSNKVSKTPVKNRITSFRAQVEDESLDKNFVSFNMLFTFNTNHGEIDAYCILGKDKTIIEYSIFL